MPRGDGTSRASEMIGDLKSRLGFSRKEEEPQDDYGEYDDFEEYDDGAYADGNYGYADDGYDADAPVGGFVAARPNSESSRRSRRFGRADSTPDLVSIDDVKAHTQVPDTLMRDPLDNGGMYETRRGRNLVQNTGPAESSPAYNAAMRQREAERNLQGAQSQSSGLDSLFEPSASRSTRAGSTGASSYDPYVAYSSPAASSYTGKRNLTVIKPITYGDVERVARAVKAGDVVVLAMRTTPDDLSKRVLDFSFGVASALDASVECPSQKVFAIARGAALSEDEKRTLRSQGVL